MSQCYKDTHSHISDLIVMLKMILFGSRYVQAALYPFIVLVFR